jgi:hypothetical protein
LRLIDINLWSGRREDGGTEAQELPRIFILRIAPYPTFRSGPRQASYSDDFLRDCPNLCVTEAACHLSMTIIDLEDPHRFLVGTEMMRAPSHCHWRLPRTGPVFHPGPATLCDSDANDLTGHHSCCGPNSKLHTLKDHTIGMAYDTV